MNVQLWSAIISASISASVAGTVGVMTWKYNQATLREKRIAEKRENITKQLNEFYGPLISYLNITNALREIYTKDKPEGFRTLTYLLDPDQTYKTRQGSSKVVLTESDRLILGEIIEIEDKIELLVVEKGGLVDEPRLMFNHGLINGIETTGTSRLSLLAELIRHFRVLKLAYAGKLHGEVQRYKDFVFPTEINRVLRDKFEFLQRELNKLSK
jgi:hypothetical protein